MHIAYLHATVCRNVLVTEQSCLFLWNCCTSTRQGKCLLHIVEVLHPVICLLYVTHAAALQMYYALPVPINSMYALEKGYSCSMQVHLLGWRAPIFRRRLRVLYACAVPTWPDGNTSPVVGIFRGKLTILSQACNAHTLSEACKICCARLHC